MSHYFDPAPATPSRRRRVDLVLPDLRAELTVDRAVFSGGGIDPGTLELLRAGAPGGPAAEGPSTDSAPAPEEAAADALLDLGCGYGPIAVTLAHRHPGAVVWAVDVNERALELTALNAAQHGFTNVRAVTPDAVPDDVAFSAIWSNPPIRIGKDALHGLLETWLPRLRPGGRAWLVVQKNLGSDSLAAWLSGRGWPTRKVASRKGYRLLRVDAAPDRSER